MFRYFGFHWNPEHPAQAVFAQRLEESVQHAQGWQPALSRPGLRVFTIGSCRGINGAYVLPRDQGIVLGHLFRRQDMPAASRDISLSASEGDQVLKTDGQALVDDYWGRYIAVVQSSHRGTCLLRDPSGTLPCYLANVEGVAVFFSWLEDLIAFTPNSPVPRVNWDAIAALTSLGHLGGRRTALEGVHQVLPGQLTPLGEGTASPMALWSAVAIARKPIEPEADIAAAQLRRAVMDCVNAWASCYESILLRLSGGVDSAILLGSLSARSTATRITCLNYHSAGSDSDERGFARLAARKAGVELIERERDAAFRLDNILAVSRTPTPAIYVGRMDTSRVDAELAAAHHARAMFTGGGGDQLFFQRRCTWPAADYLSVHGLGRGFVRASLDAARLGRVSLWQSMRRALADQGRRKVGADGIGQFLTLARHEAFDGMRHLDRYIHPDLPCATDLPIGKFHQVRDLIDPTGYYDPYLREAAPEVVDPLLSQPIIELCLALPTWLLSHGGRSRALARRAFAHDLPREIASRQSKGGMEEHVATILRSNLALARELLLDGCLVREGLLERKKVEAALAGRLCGLGTYLGEIHHYIAIEAWLRKFPESSGR
jgi:asparagine synthase (glutamine-hydrolysing)